MLWYTSIECSQKTMQNQKCGYHPTSVCVAGMPCSQLCSHRTPHEATLKALSALVLQKYQHKEFSMLDVYPDLQTFPIKSDSTMSLLNNDNLTVCSRLLGRACWRQCPIEKDVFLFLEWQLWPPFKIRTEPSTYRGFSSARQICNEILSFREYREPKKMAKKCANLAEKANHLGKSKEKNLTTAYQFFSNLQGLHLTAKIPDRGYRLNGGHNHD